MRKEDKIIAIAGIALIVVLAIVAIILLFGSRNASSNLVTVVPQTETVELNEQEADVVKPNLQAESSDVNDEKIVDANDIKGIEVTGTKEKKSDISEKYVKSQLKQVKNDDSQLKELAYYWEEYRLDAVADLIRLERLRIFTNDLAGTNEFYYCGELDDNKLPSGKGLAVYSDNTYYYGEWNKGLREGSGMWLRIFDEPSVEGDNTGVLEHQYNGQWKADLPNGEGQEHYTLQNENITGEYAIANVIGSFKNGYYDGDIYLMTAYADTDFYDWYATAKNGVFDSLEPKVSTTAKKPVWRRGTANEKNTKYSYEDYYWMSDKDNTDFGIFSLKK